MSLTPAPLPPQKIFDLDYDSSLREIARIMMDLPYGYNLEKRIEYFLGVIEEYRIDGVILHGNMSCRPPSTGMIDLERAIQESSGTPVLILTCDMYDPRAFAEEQIANRLESFFELMDSKQVHFLWLTRSLVHSL